MCKNDETVDCSVKADCVAAGVGGKCGFAGKRDWRVPNVKELQSILNYGTFGPAVSTAFNTNCVPGVNVQNGSCTSVADHYWSSTTLVDITALAWLFHFGRGEVANGNKTVDFRVRAVRGGS
ncbi:MAG: DUF1566 domain-containing protein [Burkholderiales bacterium]